MSNNNNRNRLQNLQRIIDKHIPFDTNIQFDEDCDAIDESLIPRGKIHDRVIIYDPWNNSDARGYKGAIGSLHQKASSSIDRVVIKASSLDRREFGKKLKHGDTLIRLTTKLSSKSNNFNQVIAAVNVLTGTIRFVNTKSTEEGKFYGWDRPGALNYLAMDKKDIGEFGISSNYDESQENGHCSDFGNTVSQDAAKVNPTNEQHPQGTGRGLDETEVLAGIPEAATVHAMPVWYVPVDIVDGPDIVKLMDSIDKGSGNGIDVTSMLNQASVRGISYAGSGNTLDVTVIASDAESAGQAAKSAVEVITGVCGDQLKGEQPTQAVDVCAEGLIASLPVFSEVNEGTITRRKPGEANTQLERKYIQYVKNGDSYEPAGPCTLLNTLDRFAYQVEATMTGVKFVKVRPATDELYTFENSVMSDVMEEVSNFWDLREDFHKLGLMHTRGVLLFGRPGTGKTALLHQIAEMVVDRGDIVLYAKSIGILMKGLQAVRSVEEERQIIVILEDMDEHLGYEQQKLLQLLDGADAMEGILYLGTTNYIDKFPPRLLRPGRFDTKVEVPPPPYEGRYVYLKNKIGEVADDKEIKRLAKDTDGLSFGHLRELVIGAYALKQPMESVLRRLKGAHSGLAESHDMVLQNAGVDVEDELFDSRENEDQVVDEMPGMSGTGNHNQMMPAGKFRTRAKKRRKARTGRSIGEVHEDLVERIVTAGGDKLGNAVRIQEAVNYAVGTVTLESITDESVIAFAGRYDALS